MKTLKSLFSILFIAIMLQGYSQIDVGIPFRMDESIAFFTGSTQIVTVSVKTYSNQSIDSIPIYYQYNGVIVQDTVIGPVTWPNGLWFSFTTPIVIQPGDNPIICYVAMPGDQDISNDTLYSCIAGMSPTIMSIPFLDDFEASTLWGAACSDPLWEEGVPNGTTIDTAHGGINAWVTNLNGITPNYSNIALYSPEFSIVQPGTLNLQFWHFMDFMPGESYGHIQYSTNGGISWSILGFIGHPHAVNWYDASNGGAHGFNQSNTGWVLSSIELDPMMFPIGSNVRFRFEFVSSSQINTSFEGWAIDDVELYYSALSHDVGVTAIELEDMYFPWFNPVFDTIISPHEYQVTCEIVNFGTNPATNIPISLIGNNTNYGNGIYSNTILPSDTAYFIFPNNFTSPIGPLKLCAQTLYPSDLNSSNDTLCKSYIGIIIEGIEEEEEIYSFKSYPNPGASSTVVEYKLPKSGVTIFQIANVLGKVIYEEQVHRVAGNHKTEIDVSNYSSGIYYYSLEFEGVRLSRKMVITR